MRRQRGAAARPGSPLELYLRESRYPPTSRPLSHEHTPDLIDWNVRQDEPWRAAADPRIELMFTADVVHVVGDRPVTATLRATRDGAPLDVRITDARVTPEGPMGPALPTAARPVPLTFARRGDAHVATFEPAALPPLPRAVDLVFRVEVDLGDGRLERGAFAVGYTPATVAPARFTGRFRDAIEDGSLVVHAELEVTQPGWYNLDANLWATSGEPVAWTRFKGELAAGTTEVPLVFFGKAVVDAGVAGPWRVAELRGFRFDPEAAPAEQWLASPAPAHTTAAHPLAALSPAEWDSPQRDQQVRMLLADEAAGQAPPIPAGSFAHDLAR